MTSVFREFGQVWVKIRRDHKNMPFAFCQYSVCLPLLLQYPLTHTSQTQIDAENAIRDGRGRLIHGRPCRCEKAKAHRKSSPRSERCSKLITFRTLLRRAHVWQHLDRRRVQGALQSLRPFHSLPTRHRVGEGFLQSQRWYLG